jgi:tripartite ATP-independent transporter DctM subunit
MSWGLLLFLLFGALFIILLSGIPISFGVSLLAVATYLLVVGPQALTNVGTQAWSTCTSWVLTTLPMFILMAEIIIATGMGSGIFSLARKALRWLPGGLAISTVLACGLFSAAIGTSTATAIAVGKLSIPEMIKRGYEKRLALGTTAIGGTLGILIPPSLVMIVYGTLTEQSIVHLFIAGIVPGIITVLGLSLFIVIRVILNPKLVSISHEISNKKINSEDVFSEDSRFTQDIKESIGVVVIICILFVALYGGITTATEAGAVGAISSLMLAIIYRRLTMKVLVSALLSSVKITSFVLFVIIAANLFASATSYLGVSESLVNWAVGFELPPMVMLIFIFIIYIVLGMFLDPAGMMALTIPFVFPLILKLGFDPIWFGVVFTILCEIGYLTPPFGFNLFVIKGISPPNTTIDDVIAGSLPFVLVLAVVVIILVLFPNIALWLPSTM